MKLNKETKPIYLTDKQRDYIESLADQLSYGRQDLLERATKISSRLITNLGQLKIEEASDLIKYLLEERMLK